METIEAATELPTIAAEDLAAVVVHEFLVAIDEIDPTSGRKSYTGSKQLMTRKQMAEWINTMDPEDRMEMFGNLLNRLKEDK